jgi:hypothetical protein
VIRVVWSSKLHREPRDPQSCGKNNSNELDGEVVAVFSLGGASLDDGVATDFQLHFSSRRVRSVRVVGDLRYLPLVLAIFSNQRVESSRRPSVGIPNLHIATVGYLVLPVPGTVQVKV